MPNQIIISFFPSFNDAMTQSRNHAITSRRCSSRPLSRRRTQPGTLPLELSPAVAHNQQRCCPRSPAVAHKYQQQSPPKHQQQSPPTSRYIVATVEFWNHQRARTTSSFVPATVGSSSPYHSSCI
jgi:hypothetical protein